MSPGIHRDQRYQIPLEIQVVVSHLKQDSLQEQQVLFTAEHLCPLLNF